MPPVASLASPASIRAEPDPAGELLPGVTALIPAYNEAATITDTIRSLWAQTIPLVEIIVVDDCSTDGTGEIARAAGATVVRTPRNGGSKATAQNAGLPHVRTAYTLSIDADTILAPDAVEKILVPMADPQVAAACGYVVPRYVRTIWERGRYIEYLFAFAFYKSTQEFYGQPFIASGCFALYRSRVLFEMNGWPTRTVAEDMDLTWAIYDRGERVRFVPDAISFPIEPRSLTFLRRQLRRWNHGFVQNVIVHRDTIMRQPFLRSAVAVALWDAAIASLAFLLLLPAMAITISPWWLLGYLIDLPPILVPVLMSAAARREVGLALRSIPGFLVMRWVNAISILRALFSELVVRRRLDVFEKGH
jgi:biofilm PGA synthesis N-glycosyltransferase PgaC